MAAEQIAIEVERRRQERDLRRKLKEDERQAKKAAERAAIETSILADEWNQDEQIRFEEALLMYTPSLDKYDRWTKIAAAVPGRTPNQCIRRYKFIKEMVLLRMDK